jgi:hypothetical protein
MGEVFKRGKFRKISPFNRFSAFSPYFGFSSKVRA